ncbi:MAG: flagellar M-ring protein FliF [endosymbiont of Galathealinum brachiosum]|uniref:Flagellar M-ring protein n=1 Tax=endosymbiont of Galathealinum brachiosum TaxID=2200906 RepID=A0A370DIM3_9GAMM|nr:MAG: flagellar M-ring protein FliF [endosymbiont of Galathealinum brachiosum]
MAEQAAVPNTTMMIPVPRFIGAILGVVVTVLVSIGIYTWGTAPSFSSLYTGLEPGDAAEVVAALQSAAIPYELNAASGSVMVESGRVHEARLNLAAQGLPKGTAIGVEMLQQEQSFGTSQFVESARYHHAMETELARTISTMRNVKSARVHLAIPKSSVFVRKKQKPSASVALSLYGGRVVEAGQVNAIIHMVASSISNLTAENVTVVDQNGRLLSSGDLESNVALTAREYDYSRQVENDFEQRIERLLEPIMGAGKVRATVNAKIDFTQQESTEELYNNANQTLRSEQSSQSQRFSGRNGGGVPGALVNQPPDGGQLVEGAGGVGQGGVNGAPSNSSRNSVRNYEVDRTIRHSRTSSGIVQRLTVAVLVDDRIVVEDGESTRTPLTEDEIKRLTTLVQQTIGFDQQRGDLVNVINASFTPVETIEDLPEPSIMDNKWVQFALKWIWPFILILIVIFTILKPSIKGLTSYVPPAPVLSSPQGAEGEGGTGEGSAAQLEHQEEAIPLPSDADQKIEFAKSMVAQDPKKVANVVKDWVGAES